MWFLGSILFSSLSLLTSGIAALFLTAAAIVFLGMGIYSWIKK
jgi:hypothetical protein